MVWHYNRSALTMKRAPRLLPVLLFVGMMFGVAVRAKEPSANLELARQLNQAFVEVAEKVTPAVVVINVLQKPAAPAAETDEENSGSDLPREFRRYFRQQFDEPPEKALRHGSGV